MGSFIIINLSILAVQRRSKRKAKTNKYILEIVGNLFYKRDAIILYNGWSLKLKDVFPNGKSDFGYTSV